MSATFHRALKRVETKLYHYVDDERVQGPPDGLSGDVSRLSGNASGLIGDATGLSGNVTGLSGDASDLSGDVIGPSGNVTGLIGDVTVVIGGAHIRQRSPYYAQPASGPHRRPSLWRRLTTAIRKKA
ncbi:MAG: hypothetical protein ACK5LJ_07235 [Paracoccus sp. (in: a-proteobacteria)]